MSNRIRAHLRSNVIGYMALFFALTGTAVALPGHNTVFSDDIKNDQVKAADIRENAVGPSELRTDAVGSAVIRADAVGSDEIGADAVGSSEVANNAVTSAKIANNAVGGAQIADGYSAAASDTGGGCNDDDSNGEVCATTNITLSETAKLLVNATGGWHTHGTSGAMSCRLDHDGIETIGTPQSIGEVGADHPLGGGDGTMAITGLSADIGPGTHAISLICTQTDADLDLTNSNLTVATVDE
jgi:hypothetical protein